MAAYLIIEGAITDQTRWAAYRSAVVPLIERFGGKRFNASHGAERLEGVNENRILALFEFSSTAELKAFWASPEYVPVKMLRQCAATLEIWAVASG